MRGMKSMTTKKTQANMRSKAAALLEPGVTAMSKPRAMPANPAPLPQPKQSSAARRQQIANERPMAFAKGGKVAKASSVQMPSMSRKMAASAPAKPGIQSALAEAAPLTVPGVRRGFKAGGKAKHDDEAQDKALFKKMFKQEEAKEAKGMKSGGKACMAKGGKFIQKAIKKPGQLHRDLGVPQGEKIPAAKLKAAASRPGKVGQRARFAETLKGFAAGGAAKVRKGVANPDGSVKQNAVPRNKVGRF